MSAISIGSVTKRYRDGTVAVRDLSLEIADGELMVLVGPSGCGKTTLLRMIAGLEEITVGEISIGDRVVNDLTPKDRDIAMVFQNYALYPHMTVAKNMGFALKRAGVPGEEIRRKVEQAAGLLGITEQLERKPANLSGGQRQRVAMGRAIVRDPQAFLMDEPLSNLDAKLRLQTRAEILRIQRRLRTTTVYVTHDQVEAMTLGDRLAVMRDGVLQQVGEPAELYERPLNLFVAGFIGSPSMNFLPGEIVDGSLKFPLATVPLEKLGAAARAGVAGARKVVVGIRPEDFEDASIAGERGRGVTVKALIDVLESTGSDLYAHLSLNGQNGVDPLGEEAIRHLEAAGTASGEGAEVVPTEADLIARLDASSKLGEGQEGELWLDSSKLHLFDPDSGERISEPSEPAELSEASKASEPTAPAR
jgi:multiple sugar transport system ATP-binding protein